MEELEIFIPPGLDGEWADPAFSAPNLPYNYVPAVFSGNEDEQDRGNRLVLIMPKAAETAPETYEFHVLSEDVLADPSQVSGALFSLVEALGLQDIGEVALLGPRTALAPNLFPSIQSDELRPYAISIAPNPVQMLPAAKRVVVIIDHGIAFWNQRFKTNIGSRFKEIRFLDFDQGQSVGSPFSFSTLDEMTLSGLAALADAPGGEAAIIEQLQALAPSSFYGDPAGVYRDGFWHGSAIADIAFGDEDFGEETLVYGIELPRATIDDAKGDLLGAVLPVAVQMAISMTETAKNLPLVIAAAFAFPAARHDGQHPAARSISAVLAATSRRRQVSLVLPAGNNLQDRGVACLEPSGKGIEESRVTWQIPPDDGSPNAVDILLEWDGYGPEPALSLAAPGMAQMPILMPPGAALPILSPDNQVLGRVVRRSDIAGYQRYRIGLRRTGHNLASTLCAPFGAWTISVKSQASAWLWILRDDTDRYSARGPIRASEFDDPDYRERNPLGDFILDDLSIGHLRRSGTASILTTASYVTSVQANERIDGGAERSSTYSARRFDGTAFDSAVVIEDRERFDGIEAVGNGGDRVFRVQGTSAAVGVVARDMLRLIY